MVPKDVTTKGSKTEQIRELPVTRRDTPEDIEDFTPLGFLGCEFASLCDDGDENRTGIQGEPVSRKQPGAGPRCRVQVRWNRSDIDRICQRDRDRVDRRGCQVKERCVVVGRLGDAERSLENLPITLHTNGYNSSTTA